jgi:hypothetical protein
MSCPGIASSRPSRSMPRASMPGTRARPSPAIAASIACPASLTTSSRRALLAFAPGRGIARPGDPVALAHGHAIGGARPVAAPSSSPGPSVQRTARSRLASVKSVSLAIDQHIADVGVAFAEGGQARRQPHREEIARRGDGIDMAGLAGLHRLHRILEMQESRCAAIPARLSPRRSVPAPCWCGGTARRPADPPARGSAGRPRPASPPVRPPRA